MSSVLSATREQQIEWLVSGYIREEIVSETNHGSVMIPDGVKQTIGNSMFVYSVNQSLLIILVEVNE